VRGGMSVSQPSLSPSRKAASPTFTEVWQREHEKPESPFDSALFSSSLYPADGAGDTGPQPSPLPPKPKAFFILFLVERGRCGCASQEPHKYTNARNLSLLLSLSLPAPLFLLALKPFTDPAACGRRSRRTWTAEPMEFGAIAPQHSQQDAGHSRGKSHYVHHFVFGRWPSRARCVEW
jgi:hypothetical protein